jgi:hypothetical protein
MQDVYLIVFDYRDGRVHIIPYKYEGGEECDAELQETLEDQFGSLNNIHYMITEHKPDIVRFGWKQ